MRVNIHRSDERGGSDHGWLRSNFSFSFADYFNRSRMGFGVLRVLNDDVIAPSTGFPMHPHNDMEIITVVTEGVLEHKDSLGNGSKIYPGEVQRMSAGRGIVHSEWNPSETETLKLFQIWIQTRDKGIEPEYDQKSYDPSGLVTLASGDGKGILTIHQDAWLKRGFMEQGDEINHELVNKENGIFIFVISGSVGAGGETLNARDSAEITDISEINIIAKEKADILLFEVPL